jgi:beta-lactamase class D
MTGSFIFYDLKEDLYIRYNPKRCSKRFIPASTFKILNSLIGLETAVIPDQDYVLRWDGTQYPAPDWNRDHTLKSAIKYSVVWYYQELARRIGYEKMYYYVYKCNYGNKDISGGIDRFWLDGALRISQSEQIELLKKMYKYDLPFSKRNIDIVKDILLNEENGSYRLRAKTGSSFQDGRAIGWYVGYLEQNDNVYFFATNIESDESDQNFRNARIEITRQILQRFGLLKSSS